MKKTCIIALALMFCFASVYAQDYFTIGSHKDDVLRLQGTPDDISRYSALGHETWAYGNSRVNISIMSAQVIDYSNNGTLQVKGTADTLKRVSKYHHRHKDVTFYYDKNKSYTGVISFDDENIGKVYGAAKEGVMYFYSENFAPLNECAYSDGESIRLSSVRGSYDATVYKNLESTIAHIEISGDVSGSGTSMRFGNITLTDLLTDNGSYIHGTSLDFGTIEFDDYCSIDGVTTTGSRINIGDISFGDWFSSDGGSISESSQRIGNFIFHNYTGSDGKTYRGLTTEIGDFSFTDVYDW
jgi:hypothetical protein